MQRNRKQGFTLVELLMVITIIGILMAMVIPAVSNAFGNVDVMTCKSRLGELHKSTELYVGKSGGFYPPLIGNRDPNLTGRSTDPEDQMTLFAFLLNYNDNTDLYKKIKNRETDSLTEGSEISAYMCPSDLSDNMPNFYPTSYVANAGLDSTFGKLPMTSSKRGRGSKKDEWRSADGVFANNVSKTIKRKVKKLTTGVSTTILFTENVQAGSWYLPGGYENEKLLLNHVAVVWNLEKFLDRDRRVQTPYDMNTPTEGPTKYNAMPLSPTIRGETSNIDFARPSSMHPGGAQVVYASGTVEFIDIAGMDKNIYVQLMCSNWESSTPVSKYGGTQEHSWIKELSAP